MKLGVYSATSMTSDLQTNVIPLIVDIEITVKEPRQASHGA